MTTQPATPTCIHRRRVRRPDARAALHRSAFRILPEPFITSRRWTLTITHLTAAISLAVFAGWLATHLD